MADQLSNNLAALKIDRSVGRPPGSSLWKNLVIAALLLGGAGAAYVYGMPALEGKVFKTEVEFTEVALVSPAQAAIELTSTGYLVPQTLSKIAAKIGGRVAKVHVRQGSNVKAGDVLIELDPTVNAAERDRLLRRHPRRDAGQLIAERLEALRILHDLHELFITFVDLHGHGERAVVALERADDEVREDVPGETGDRWELPPRSQPIAAREIEEAAVVLLDVEARPRGFEDLVQPSGAARSVDHDVGVDSPGLARDLHLGAGHADRLLAFEHETFHVRIGDERRDPLLLDVQPQQPLERRSPRRQRGQHAVDRFRPIALAVPRMQVLLESPLADAGSSHPLEQTRMTLDVELAQPPHEEVRMYRVRHTAPSPVDLRVRRRRGIALEDRHAIALRVERERRVQAGDAGTDDDRVTDHAPRAPLTSRPGRAPVSWSFRRVTTPATTVAT